MAVSAVAPGEDARQATTVQKVARNTAWQMLGEVFGRLGTLLFYVTMARRLGEHRFGDFNFALAVALVVSFAGFGTDLATMREVAKDPSRLHALFWNSNVIKLVVGVLGIAIAVAIGYVGKYSDQVQVAIALLAVAALADILARTAQSVFRGLEDMAPIAFSLIAQRLWLAVVGVSALALGAGLVTASAIYLTSSIVGLTYISVSLVRRGNRPVPVVSYKAVRILLTDSLPAAFGIVFVTILARLDTVILSLLKGDAAVGIYNASYRLFEAATLVSVVFAQALYPVMSRLSTRTTPTVGQAYETALKAVTMVLFPLSLAAAFFSKAIIQLLYGRPLASAAAPLTLLAPTIWLWGVFLVSMLVLTAQRRQRLVAWGLAAGTVMNGALNVALVPTASYRGSAVAMTVSMLLICTALAVVARVTLEHAVAIRRVFGSPLLGVCAMCLARLLLGDGLVVVPVSVSLYVGTVLVVERWRHPEDLQLMMKALDRRTRGGAVSGGSGD